MTGSSRARGVSRKRVSRNYHLYSPLPSSKNARGNFARVRLPFAPFTGPNVPKRDTPGLKHAKALDPPIKACTEQFEVLEDDKRSYTRSEKCPGGASISSARIVNR